MNFILKAQSFRKSAHIYSCSPERTRGDIGEILNRKGYFQVMVQNKTRDFLKENFKRWN
ncbi:hypothetical protein CLV48_107216 [Cecembia rubra]|uniref:Uncharacterized protein n=1 Tax=Cecembia rubra TaxID=1485585 RepID=A0A2P8E1Y8_9BACT|nr:hypothetical protein CLV48_107216 [Cecembia rubra]